MVDIWYTDKVVSGTGGGKKLGFPTINLNADRFIGELKEGIYSCLVEYNKKQFLGALYFGPRYISNGKKYILEIHIIDFDKTIYGKTVEFKIDKFIRAPVDVKNQAELVDLIKNDVKTIKSL